MTQRSPLRDADVPYLYGKFYSASRFDSLIDGINREITARLTNARRAGSSPFNTNTFPGINSFYSYKCVQNGTEAIRVLADGQDGVIYDATAGQKSTLFTKTTAAKARFLGVNTELFFTDGVDLEKWLYPGPWQASTNVLPGVLINVGAEPGTMQMALGGITLPIVAFASDGTNITLYVNPQNVTNQFPNLLGVNVAFSGLGVATFLNGHSYPVSKIVSTTLGIFQIVLAHAVTAETTDAGTGTTGTGTTGGTIPTFSTTEFAVTADGGQQWKCYGAAMGNWGLQAPTNSPALTPLNGTRFWQPNTTLANKYVLLDNNGNIQIALSGASFTTGRTYPVWNPGIPGAGTQTKDGDFTWYNWGPCGSWTPSTAYGTPPYTNLVILDSNGNLQVIFSGGAGTSGTTKPTWNATLHGNTTDGTVTWVNYGPGTILASEAVTYSFSTHAIDGSVSTAAPVQTIPGGILGPALAANLAFIAVAGNFTPDVQIDQIWIWRTAQGQSTLILEDQIPVDGLSGSFTYNELGIPDTSTNGGGALIPEAPAPIAESNNPPPAGMVAPCFHLGRVFAILNNTVVWSGGPDTITGNGNTAFPPNNYVPLTEQPVRLYSGVTNQGATLFIFGTTNVYCIFGTGTSANPFTPATLYMPSVGLLSYDAFDVVGSTFYLMTGKGKVVALDPGGGYAEQGFPIGDQFKNVTTGLNINYSYPVGISFAQFTPGFNTVELSFYGAIPAWLVVGAQVVVNISDPAFNTNVPQTVVMVTPGTPNYFAYHQNLGGSPIPLEGNEPVTGSVYNSVTPLGTLYSPATAYVAFCEISSGDTAVYVSDGAVGWFRFSPIASPESGYIWSPRAAIVGGTSAVQSIETSPGVSQLLIGPPAGTPGPILFRDSSVNADWTGGAYVAYPSWDVKGNIVLCQSGEVAEIAHVGLKSVAVGARPSVSLLLGEIAPTTAVPFETLAITSNDPPDLPASQTLFSDRYSALQNGVCPKCDNFQLKVDYGSQNVPDELLMFSVYGAKHAERKQQ